MRRLIILMCVAGFAATPSHANAKGRYLDIAPQGENQRSRMDAGVEAIDSNLEHSSVRILESEDKIGKRGKFSIVVFNASDAPANLGSENISIVLADGTSVAVITYERLLKEEKNRQMWARIAAGLSAASNNMAASEAGYSSGTATYSGTSFGRFGTVNSHGTATVSGYDSGTAYAAQANANAQNQQMFDRLSATNAANLEALKANLRTTTVDPGAAFGGLATFELPTVARRSKVPVRLTVTIDFAGDRHQFSAEVVQR